MNVSEALIRSWSRLGQRATFFAIAMPEIAKEKDNLMVVTADLSILSNLTKFAEQFPDKFLNVGIAEQNMIGISAGMAMDGYTVFATTYSSFIAVRSLEHVRQHLSNLSLDVKLVGTAAGVVAARSGVAHWASEDLTFMRALPNMVVLCAADAFEAYQMAFFAAKEKKPMYVRINGTPNCPIVHGTDYVFEPYKLDYISKGNDVALLATGLMVNEAVETAKLLNEKGISSSVINVHTLKPLDEKGLENVFRSHKLIVSMEEHNIIGGLGGAIAECKSKFANMPKQIFVGIQDSFCKAGSQRYIWEQFGMTSEQVAERVMKELK